MPPGKRRQSNAMLYTLVTFVGLFIAATTVAVIYYVKAEELRTTRDDLQDQINGLADRDEQRNVAAIIGTKLSGRSSLGTMTGRLDEMVRLVKGAPVQATSAEVKVASAMQAVQPLLDRARAFIPLPVAAPTAIDPNAENQDAGDPNAAPQVALTALISDLLMKLEQTTTQKNAAEKELATFQKRFDDAVAAMQETEQALTAKVNGYDQQVQSIKTDYDNLKALVQQNFGEREKGLLNQLETARNESRQLNQDLLKTQAELNVATGRLAGALAAVSEIRPAPDHEVTAFKKDGDIILVDQSANNVRINLGSEDCVYRGLTFSVYDRAGGIPRDGKPKAQVEVIAIDRMASLARILSSDPRNPILTGDLVANLIWDCRQQTRFVIAGEFDIDRDGATDYDAAGKIESLIRRWGGEVAREITADTDYVILGNEPKVPPQPTLEIQQQNPTAMERYNAAQQMNGRYHDIRKQAEALYVPIFSYDRFLHFTGYASQVSLPGAF